MKFLYVKGDDYSAVHFENNFSVEEIYNQMVSEGVEGLSLEGDDYHIDVELLEFDDIDPDFINFIKNELCDYDALKHSNIYQINEIKEIKLGS